MENNSSANNNWQNIGIFSQYARKEMIKHSDQKKDKKYNKTDAIFGMTRNMHNLYMLIVEYSFGYGDHQVQIGITQMCNELQMTNKTILNIINQLFEAKYISRMEWQNYGPKQRYTYEVNLEHINHKIHYKKYKECENQKECKTNTLGSIDIKNIPDKGLEFIQDWCTEEGKKRYKTTGKKQYLTIYDFLKEYKSGKQIAEVLTDPTAFFTKFNEENPETNNKRNEQIRNATLDFFYRFHTLTHEEETKRVMHLL